MSIDSLYGHVIKKLTKQSRIKTISHHLVCLKNVDNKVLYIHELIHNLNCFPRLLEVSKSKEISIHYRNLGNKRFYQSDDYKAWQYYNLSLLYAPLDSECYSLTLANRSAVFFSLQKFAECSKDIDHVFSMKYPENLKEKLTKRRALCKDVILEEADLNNSCSDAIAYLNLQDPQYPRFPCASSKVEVVFSEEMGRHVVAKTDIRVGEVLVQEDPYFMLLLQSQCLISCSYCLSRSSNLLPCHHCCFVLYCSEKCRENAWKDYHEIECPLMPTLIDMQFTKLELLALRTVIKARNDHSDWDSLFKTIEHVEENEETEYRGHIKINDEWVYDSKYYASIHSLASNIEKRSVSDIFQKGVSAAVFLWMLEEKTSFMCAPTANEEQKKKIRKYVAGNLLHHIMTSPTNMHGISTNVETADGDFIEEYSLGSAPYAFHSLINHSCAPNVVRFCKLGTGRMTLFALRPIKKGMQLFDNYGAHHAIQDRKTRQDNLKFQYKFTCNCKACVKDWPTYKCLKPAKDLPTPLIMCKNNLLNSEVLECLQKGNEATAKLVFKPLCELAEELEKYAPCTELADCQETLKQCLQILHGVVPYAYSQLVEWSVNPPKI